MTQKQVRAIIRWPDGITDVTDWAPDGHDNPALDILFENIREVLDRRYAVGGAMITWENREIEADQTERAVRRMQT